MNSNPALDRHSPRYFISRKLLLSTQGLGHHLLIISLGWACFLATICPLFRTWMGQLSEMWLPCIVKVWSLLFCFTQVLEPQPPACGAHSGGKSSWCTVVPVWPYCPHFDSFLPVWHLRIPLVFFSELIYVLKFWGYVFSAFLCVTGVRPCSWAHSVLLLEIVCCWFFWECLRTLNLSFLWFTSSVLVTEGGWSVTFLIWT